MAWNTSAFSLCTAPKPRYAGGSDGQQSNDLEEMVLDHVPQAAGALVERAPLSHAEVLG